MRRPVHTASESACGARPPGGASLSARRPRSWRVASAAVLVLLGCADRAPQARLAALETGLEAARADGAERSFPESFARAESLLGELRQEVDRHVLGWPWQGRRRRLLERLEPEVAALRLRTAQMRVHSRQAARRALGEARQALARAVEGYTRLPVGKDTAPDLAGMRVDLERLRLELAGAESRFERQEYGAAAERSLEVARRATAVAEAIEGSVDSQLAVAAEGLGGRTGLVSGPAAAPPFDLDGAAEDGATAEPQE